jgi:hypothetical protein
MHRLQEMMKVAILDDYQGVALKMADWSILKDKAELTVFREFMGKKLCWLKNYGILRSSV